MTPDELRDWADRVIAEVERVIVGKHEVVELLVTGLLADGNIVIEDMPGLAKTLMARSMAEAIGLSWSRIQFTPDLLPGDVTGSSVFDPARAEFVFHPGPLFANLVLGDEINRAPPKTQAALLEAMQERQVTVDGTTHLLDRPFFVLATQNPIEYEGTYPLPEAQLDRFLLRLRVGYPTPADEREILERRILRRVDDVVIDTVTNPAELLAAQAAVEDIHVSGPVLDYIIALVGAPRTHIGLSTGSSPRGSLALLRLSRVRAALAGRSFVTPDDVKHVAVPALGHRLVVKPELWVRGADGDEIVVECLDEVPTPSATEVLTTTIA